MGATDRLHIELQRMAIGYEWRPGERINELELSRQLKVSRSPLREALNRLVAEGFWYRSPIKASFVGHSILTSSSTYMTFAV